MTLTVVLGSLVRRHGRLPGPPAVRRRRPAPQRGAPVGAAPRHRTWGRRSSTPTSTSARLGGSCRSSPGTGRWPSGWAPSRSTCFPSWSSRACCASTCRTRLWKAVHLTSYLLWPLAFVHGITAGTDLGGGWLLVLVLACASRRGLGLRRRPRRPPEHPAACRARRPPPSPPRPTPSRPEPRSASSGTDDRHDRTRPSTRGLLDAPGPALADHLAAHGPLPDVDLPPSSRRPASPGAAAPASPRAAKLRSVAARRQRLAGAGRRRQRLGGRARGGEGRRAARPRPAPGARRARARGRLPRRDRRRTSPSARRCPPASRPPPGRRRDRSASGCTRWPRHTWRGRSRRCARRSTGGPPLPDAPSSRRCASAGSTAARRSSSTWRPWPGSP